VVAGGHGLGRQIQRVKVLEAPETFHFVAEGDLLLTVGYAVKDDPAVPAETVRQLATRSAAGLPIKPEP
jgi:purine catabolism regulator